MTGDTLISVCLPDIAWRVYCSDGYVPKNGKPAATVDLKGKAGTLTRR